MKRNGAKHSLAPAASLFVAAALYAQSAAAQTARLEFGEHGDFTRITLLGAPTSGWRAEDLDDGVALSLPGAGVRLRDVETLMRSHGARIASIDQRDVDGDSRVVVRFSCDCDAQVYPLAGRALVIDVRDRAAAAQVIQRPERAPIGAEASDSAERDVARLLNEARQAAKAANDAARQAAAEAAAARAANGQDALTRANGEAAPADIETAQISPGELEDDIARARRILMEQLQKAADEGLIEFKNQPQPQDAPGSAASAEAPDLETAGEPDAPTEPAVEPAEPPSSAAAAPAGAPLEPFLAETPTAPTRQAEAGLAPRQAEQPAEPTRQAEAPSEPLPAEEPAEPTRQAETPSEPLPAEEPAEPIRQAEAPSEPLPAEEPAEPTRQAEAPSAPPQAEKPTPRAEAPPEPAPQETPQETPQPQQDVALAPTPAPIAPIPETPAPRRPAPPPPLSPQERLVAGGAQQPAPLTPATPEPPLEQPVFLSVGDLRGARISLDGLTPAASSDDVAPPPSAATAANACLPDDHLDAAEWMPAAPFAEALSKRRASLYNELNRPQADQVLGLMQFYVGHLFTAEAAAAPATYDVDGPKIRSLRAVARVLDGKEPETGGPFAPGDICTGRHALWQAAAWARADHDAAARAYEASGRALSRTPAHIRAVIGPRIGLATARAGDMATAAEILRLLERTELSPTVDHRLLRAAVARAQGDIDMAVDELSIASASRSPDAPLAAIALADLVTGPERDAKARELSETLGSYSLQHRGGPWEARLVDATAQLLTRYGALSEALSTIDAAITRDRGEAWTDATRLLELRLRLIAQEIGVVRRTGSPARAVQAAGAAKALPPGPTEDALRLALSAHLIDAQDFALARVVLDESFAARNDEAAFLRGRAFFPGDVAAPATDPFGALNAPDEELADLPLMEDPFASAFRPTAAEPAPGADPEEAATARRNARTEALSAPLQDPSADPSAGAGLTPSPRLQRGEALLNELETDIDLLREVASDG